jgi:NSS family neurotransmitter:Na+ symporter
MWRFSYMASQGGGASFVLLYLVFVAVVGLPLMTSEFVVGRMAQESPARAVRRLGGRAWGPLGVLFVFCGFGILSYYSVIAGWTMRYALDALRNAIPADTGGYFAAVSEGSDALIAHLVFMGMTIFIVMGGVKKGLERAALILMPILFVLLVGLAIWSATLGGAEQAYTYYLRPTLRDLFDRAIITDAAGQAFFSLSLGMGALMTYASYLHSKENLAREAGFVALTDFGVAFIAGLVVFPVIFSFGLLDQVGGSAVGALFISLPAGFEQLGRLGSVIQATFFVMLLFAALTSSISLLEVVVAAAVDVWGWVRRRAALTLGAIIALIGIPSAFSTDFLGAADAVVGNFLLIVGGFFTAILVGYRILPQADAELARGLQSRTARAAWKLFVRYLSPAVLLVVLFFLIKPTWQAVLILLGAGGN